LIEAEATLERARAWPKGLWSSGANWQFALPSPRRSFPFITPLSVDSGWTVCLAFFKGDFRRNKANWTVCPTNAQRFSLFQRIVYDYMNDSSDW